MSARAAGAVDVRVVTAGGSSPVSPTGRFTYTGGLTAASTSGPADPDGSDDEPPDAANVDLVMTLLYTDDPEEESDFSVTEVAL